MSGYCDIHSHIIYGLDDGAQTREDMEAMLDAAYADGITSIVATPHVTPGIYPLKRELLNRHLEEARAYCRAKGYPMDLHAGAEILFTPALARFAQEGQLPTLADSDCILMEFVTDISYEEMDAALDMLEHAGYEVIIAHIERYECMYHRNHAYRLKDRHDVRYQVNCGPVLRKRGLLKDHHLRKWLQSELVDFVATDSHDTQRRPSQMGAAHRALEQRVRKAYADRLVSQWIC